MTPTANREEHVAPAVEMGRRVPARVGSDKALVRPFKGAWMRVCVDATGAGGCLWTGRSLAPVDFVARRLPLTLLIMTPYRASKKSPGLGFAQVMLSLDGVKSCR